MVPAGDNSSTSSINAIIYKRSKLVETIAVIKRWTSWRPGRLARNTVHAGTGNIVRVCLQAASLILMARVFGAAGYGVLAGTIALYTTIAQLVGLGSGIALVRHLAKQGELHGKLRSTQLVYLITSVVLLLLISSASTWLFGHHLDSVALALLAAAEIVVAPALLPMVYRYQAEERLAMSGALQLVGPVARFAAVIGALLAGINDLAAFSVLYLVSMTAAVLLAFWRFWPRCHSTPPHYRIAQTVREGLPFVVSGIATTAGGELDKTILLRFVGATATGQYAAAYRVMSAATLPINSLIMAASARMFRPREGTSTALRKTLLAVTVIYASIAATLLATAAPAISWILGEQFEGSVSIIRWLCVVLMSNSLRQLIGAYLTTTDRQHTRNIIELCGLALSLCALLVLVPRMGAYGAIAAAFASDLLVIATGLAYLGRHKKIQEA